MSELLPLNSTSVDLSGKSAWITGGAQGLGYGIAKSLAGAGARVAIVDRNRAVGMSVASELSGAIFIEADIRNESAVQASLEESANAFGGLDILVNNAGIDGQQASIIEMPSENWQEVIDINLNGVFYGLKHGLPYLKDRGEGTVLNMASTAGIVAFENIAAYCAAKAGVIALTRAAALEMAMFNIRVNALAPSVVKTKLVEHFIETSPDPDATRAGFEQFNPFPGMVSVEAVANAALYLLGPNSAFITGQCLPVDGAYTIK